MTVPAHESRKQLETSKGYASFFDCNREVSWIEYFHQNAEFARSWRRWSWDVLYVPVSKFDPLVKLSLHQLRLGLHNGHLFIDSIDRFNAYADSNTSDQSEQRSQSKGSAVNPVPIYRHGGKFGDL